jgi:hypothetical protein
LIPDLIPDLMQNWNINLFPDLKQDWKPDLFMGLIPELG